MTTIFGAQGVFPTLRGQPTNVWSIQPGNARLVPAGTWAIITQLYSSIQEYDPITTTWRNIAPGVDGSFTYTNSDGVNYRVANQTGCVVGGAVTTAGSGYTSAPTVTSNLGSPVLQAIVGGAVATSVTVNNGGTGYVYPPIVALDAPPSPGIQATAYCTISAGAVSTVTIANQGAGYTNTPNIYFFNDPRDTVGTGARATATLTGSQTVTGVIGTDFGNAIISTVVPTLTFSGGGGSSAAATAIMDWSIQSFSLTSIGGGYTAPAVITTIGTGFTTTPLSSTNPTITSALVRGRVAQISSSVSSGNLTTAGQTIVDGGVFMGIPTAVVLGFSTGSAALPTFTLGGSATLNTDTVLILSV